jgi:cell division protein FtsA
LLPAGVVLCGGTAELAGIKTFAREALQMPVRIGVPQNIEGFTDRVSSPAFATSVGLALWGLNQSRPDTAMPPPHQEHHKTNPIEGLFTWAKRAFLPG